ASGAGVCLGGASCNPVTCGSGTNLKFCGRIGDGCGRSLDCSSCPAGQTCTDGVCLPPGCVPITCAIAGGGRYCGRIGDGCGGSLDCGTCPGAVACGASVPGVCGTLPAGQPAPPPVPPPPPPPPPPAPQFDLLGSWSRPESQTVTIADQPAARLREPLSSPTCLSVIDSSLSPSRAWPDAA